jgi:DNA repair protein RecN (Recombination protein N)
VLLELHIENLGVIERAELIVGHGLTALTGETGAGKTMLIEAIELLVGGRADPAMVRSGCDEARIDGRFEGGDDGTETVLTRVVSVSGRSRAYVDGRPVPASRLGELAAALVDLHGQHAHQSLMTRAAQRAALDAFGSVDLEPLRRARARLTELDAEIALLGGDQRARAREIDLLRFQVAELDAAGLVDPTEDEQLATEESLLSDALGHREAAAAALVRLRNDHDIDSSGADGGADEAIGGALGALVGRTPFDDVAQRLDGLAAELSDIVATLRDRAEAIEEDPVRLAEIRERRQLLVDLRRKYGADLGEVMAYHLEVAERLDELERYDERAAALDVERVAAIAAESVTAHQVGEQRRAAAPRLGALVEARLRALAMPNASVAVAVGDDPGDDVSFLLSANPGSAMLPLSKVASGGELARAMLALRLVLSDAGHADAVPTMIFDEVDAGIGGAAATAVAAALAELAESRQVLVVTHLPQVASAATRQLVVRKESSDGPTATTVTSVTDVDGTDRELEIARMLAGTATPAALEHARDLLSQHSER